MTEGTEFDKKSIRVFATDPKKWAWRRLASDCAGFANARGGTILFGVEDNADAPPAGQRVPPELPDRLVKGIGQHTTNVHVRAGVRRHANGGEYLALDIIPSAKSIAATTDACFYLRVADETRRLQPDELVRLVADKDAYQWETQTTRRVPAARADPAKLARFLTALRASDRVKETVRQRSDAELLEHYSFVRDGWLTNLGVLWIGQRSDRVQLLHAPVIQFLKFDARGERVAKFLWDDFSLNPAELIEAVWTEVPDWRESTELPDGLFRKLVPHYDEVVVRELVANALVHRPYTTRGDIFINLHPEHLEVHNPGLLPLGVTPRNILQKSIRRNDLLAQVFHDLKLMEREGTGYDRIYEAQLTQGKAVPQVREEDDRVVVRVDRRIPRPELVNLLAAADQRFGLTSRERIALGLITQHGSLTALEFSRLLQIEGDDRIRAWLGRLPEQGVVLSRGQTRGTEYFVNPVVLRVASYRGPTTLKTIEPHRLRHLILEDLTVHGPTSDQPTTRAEIHARIGREIPLQKLRQALESLRDMGTIGSTGKRGRGGGYFLRQKAAK